MQQRVVMFLLAVASASPALAGSNYRYVLRPGSDVYFGHVSWCQLQNDADDPRVLRAEGPQRATVNMPLAPGDTLETTPGRRCEAQFDTGTLMRIDEQTALHVETILAPSLTTRDKLTNLQLRSGRVIVLYRDYDSRELFQILTANAAVKLSRAAVVDVQTTDDGETVIELQRGEASLMFGASAEKTQTRKLKPGERLTLTRDHTVAVAAASGRALDAFQAWNREMNERFAELHDGRNELPKPIERFPPAVIHFAQRYADPNGEWLWTELYGYVWRPYRARDVGWYPYQQGRFVPLGGRQFWVPDEPWGWVPYHLGLWHFDKKHGWVWLPGSAFAPAWVTWGVCDEIRYFRPLTLWDWSYRFAYGYRYSGYGYGSWAGYWGSCGFFPYAPQTTTVVVARELAAPAKPIGLPEGGPEDGPKPRKIPEIPLLPLPKELEVIARKPELLQQRNDGELQAHVERASGSAAQFDDGLLAPRLVDVVPLDPSEGRRFRDWNRDVKAARAVGGHIVYSSVTNLVRCESCSRPLVNLEVRSDGSMWGSPGTGSPGTTNASGSSSSGSSVSASPSASGPWSGGAPITATTGWGERKQQ
jgi:hypothetical protein